MLRSAAAARWGVSPESCQAEAGFVFDASTGRKLSYGALATEAGKLPVPDNPPLKTEAFKIVGQRFSRLDTPSKVNGSAVYGLDLRVPGMRYAALARSETIGGKVVDFDASAAKQMPGVSFVGKVGDSAVAVVADSTWNALKALRALKITWDQGPNLGLNEAAVWDSLERADETKAVKFFSAGDVRNAT